MSLNENDMTRRMLNTLREGKVTPDDTRENIFEGDDYDSTKNMLTAIREGKSTSGQLITEQSNDVIQLEGAERNEEEAKFRDVIGQRVEFTVFNIYPSANNVVFGGKFQDLGGAEWQFSLEEDDGVYLTANNMKLTTDALEKLQKLRGYYENWSEEWAEKLATEYRQNI